ncbi:MAG: nucleotide disphospho-sugar-binding domain-containing protein [Planctomycetota bacterium]
MSRIVYVWEYGGGLGHIGPFHAVASKLKERGHDVTLVVRDISKVDRLYAGLGCDVLQAPTRTRRSNDLHPHPCCLAQVLRNVGFGDRDYLTNAYACWESILRLTSPDVVVADHAPGALLALRQSGIPVVLFGLGFAHPPQIHPLPPLVPCNNDEDAAASEVLLTGEVNQVLHGHGKRGLNHFGSLYDFSDHFLLSLAELDPYPQRTSGEYVGAWPLQVPNGGMVPWPPGVGPRIFAYLKKSKGLGHLFQHLLARGNPTVIVCDGMDIEPLQRLAGPHLRFVDRPLPIDAALSDCDAAILNGGHAVTCATLLAGKPILQIPHNLEQFVTAQKCEQVGASLASHREDGPDIVSKLELILSDPNYGNAAQAFASRYAQFQPQHSPQRIAERIHNLC